jgi:hypothetical protein
MQSADRAEDATRPGRGQLGTRNTLAGCRCRCRSDHTALMAARRCGDPAALAARQCRQAGLVLVITDRGYGIGLSAGVSLPQAGQAAGAHGSSSGPSPSVPAAPARPSPRCAASRSLRMPGYPRDASPLHTPPTRMEAALSPGRRVEQQRPPSRVPHARERSARTARRAPNWTIRAPPAAAAMRVHVALVIDLAACECLNGPHLRARTPN